MQFVEYNNKKDEIIVKKHGANFKHKVPWFIVRRLHTELSTTDKLRLKEAIADHPQVLCDMGVAGNLTFYLQSQCPHIYFFVMMFPVILVTCCFLYGDSSIIFGATFAGGNFLFPFAYIMLDSLTELNGARHGKICIIVTMIICLIIAGAVELFKYLPRNAAPEIMEAYDIILEIFPSTLLSASLATAVACFLNIYVFQKIRRKTGTRFLWLRSSVSTLTSNTIFLSTAALAFYQSSIIEPEVINEVLSVAGISIFLSLCYLPSIYFMVWLSRFLSIRSYRRTMGKIRVF